MSLAAGTRLGQYEIQSALGAGGMGEVYRARDTKLGRDVAIKVLPVTVTNDAERVARFEREARTLASLNHPNIGGIYGVEEASGTAALVLELVEGPTLADRIVRGPLPVEEALAIARQIADALEAAHAHSIVHRDLKPANIKVREDGVVKVLDFGLAKALGSEGGRPDSPALTQSPTLSLAATQAGVILGTAAYMAPEQAKGRPADTRSDLWAFGCVLYEMLTGKAAFDGGDLTEVLGAVVRLEPDWTVLPPDLSPAVRALLRTCLTKDARKRKVDATAAVFVIENLAAVEAVSMPRQAALGLAAFALGGAAIGAPLWWLTRLAPPGIERFAVVGRGPTVPGISGLERSLAITPDGARIIYTSDDQRQLLVRAIDQLEPTTLVAGAIVRNVFASPDGQWIGFTESGNLLKKVAITGGPAVTVLDLDGQSRGATWTPDGTIIFATTSDSGLQRVSVAGGEVTGLTRPDFAVGELGHAWPEILPDGRAVLFTILAPGFVDAQVAVLDLTTGQQKTLVRGGSHAHYVPTGHLVYTVGTTLRAVAFDPSRLETRGAPVPVVPQVATTQAGAGHFDLAGNGTLVYAEGFGVGIFPRALVWIDRQGREQPIGAPLRAYDDISISPDGREVVTQLNESQGGGIWVYEFQRGALRRLTFDASVTQPSWSADGTRIAFAVGPSSATGRGMLSVAANGGGGEERMVAAEVVAGASSASPDGRVLVFERRGTPNFDLWVVPLSGDRTTKPFTQTAYGESAPRFSADGRWLAYASNESGQREIYVQPFPGPGGKWLVSTDGGSEAIWARDGRELFYRNGDRMMVVDVQTQPTFKASTPRMLFEAPGWDAESRVWDVAPDGRRFLIVKRADDDNAPPPQIVVVKNWFEELKRLVPAP